MRLNTPSPRHAGLPLHRNFDVRPRRLRRGLAAVAAIGVLLTAAASNATAERVVLEDALLGTTTGHIAEGLLTKEGYQPGVGSGHILYTLPETLANGAIEVEMRGMTTEGVRTGKESKAAWFSMYDGRGIAEPADYFRDFKVNFFRLNVGWNFHRGKFQCTVVAAAPTPERQEAADARFGPRFEDRDFSAEPLGAGFSWDPDRWYRVRYEWQGGRHRLLFDGDEVWRVDCPFPYAPVIHRLRLGNAPGLPGKFHNQVAGLTFRHLRVVALPEAPVRELADFPMPKPGSGGVRFMERHASFVEAARAGGIDVLFVGDSITEGWNYQPELWQKYFAPLRAANFGIGGDQTQHVLWRLQHGELEGIEPRVVVLLIGTNNTGAHSAVEIAGAIRRILRTILGRLEKTQVVLHAVFPRGPRQQRNGSFDDGVARSTTIRELNPLLAAMGTHPEFAGRVHFLDLTAQLATDDGTPRPELFSDNLHLTAEGYRVWADNLRPLLDKLLR